MAENGSNVADDNNLDQSEMSIDVNDIPQEFIPSDNWKRDSFHRNQNSVSFCKDKNMR